ncbi:MAG: DUF4417 domain-containing protein [Paludibacteraceae bacterium]|nr:DUF4417 domain-containing protein [Paludibacteraceae bacterium]
MKPTDERFLRNYNLHLLKSCTFAGAFQMPDFSLYQDMPTAMQLWNTYRNRVLTRMAAEGTLLSQRQPSTLTPIWEVEEAA